MEAMASGMPVVVSIIGATPEMITSGEDGLLVPQGDREGLAAAFTDLAHDPALRRRLGENGRRRAREQFDVRRTAGKLHEAIESARSAGT
jgi:glycosyltransferase involved in cell wall biosynthesis